MPWTIKILELEDTREPAMAQFTEKILEDLRSTSKRFGNLWDNLSWYFMVFLSSDSGHYHEKVCEEFCAEVFWFSVKAAQYLFRKPC